VDINSVQMSDWEHVREIFIGRHDWFAMQRRGRIGQRVFLSDAMRNNRSSRVLQEDSDDFGATIRLKSTENVENRHLRRSPRLIARRQPMEDGSTETKTFDDGRGLSTKRTELELTATKRMRRPSLPQLSSARLSIRDSLGSSESVEIEVISAEKAKESLTALKVPEEIGQFSSDNLLKEIGDEFVREDDQVVPSFDSDVPQSVESPMTIMEQSTLLLSPYKKYNG